MSDKAARLATLVSQGMSRAFKARSRPCPVCGRKTVQAKSKGYWKRAVHICRWAYLHETKAGAYRALAETEER